MIVKEVTTSKEFAQFIDFPWQIYRDDPYWVPPLKIDVQNTLNPKKHPFLKHGDMAKFLAVRDGQVVGRILASDDPRYNEQNRTNVGNFGLFESVDDQEVADALFEQAAIWVRKKGRNAIMGPVTYSTNYECGTLIDGFDSPPRLMMPHNPPYYSQRIEAWGFEKDKDLYAWWFNDPYDIVQKWQPFLDRIVSRQTGITVRPFSRRNFEKDVQQCMKIYDHARKNWWWACVELTSAEVRYYAKQLSMFGDENMVLLAEKDGEPIGFSITMPDLNEVIRPLNGRLTWWGLPVGVWRFYRGLKQVETARMMVLCVLPDYRQRGVAERLILETLNYGKNTRKFKAGELSWTDEDNTKINRIIERVGAKRYKTYRVYIKSLK
ncbi:MAG: GNAT family N-acetyltransferase [Planctomycetaceae bacterium]|nr:GNAT family N-acetyltransferase [Planctomycetaceae bacterium]